MAQQTAVIWLQQAMKSTLSHEQIMAVEGLYQQALAMEKELIKEAFEQGVFEGTFTDINYQKCDAESEYYYNERYNK